MPRSPQVTKAVRQLAQYFQAITDASFIDRSWSLNSETQVQRAGAVSEDPLTKINANGAIASRSVDYTVGTDEADHIANLVNGAVCIGDFLTKIPKLSSPYDEQFKFYYVANTGGVPQPVIKPVTGVSDLPGASNPSVKFEFESGKHPNVNLYALVVNNPFLGPTTKDSGAIEIFMNAIPTLEFSKCVPFVNLEMISLSRTAGTVAPPLTLIGFLNPSKLSDADKGMLGAQGAIVRTEAATLGSGLRSGMELFTAPQTLVNMGEIGPEFVPTIDRFRPLASLGNLSLSTKVQGATIPFTTGRLELTIHDRSRLREMAAFLRPDLYGTTFLDITYGWAHPEGGAQSRNSFGIFLDALKNTTRFRIAGSTYAFEEGGQVKVTLNIQTVGSTDLLYLGPRNTSKAFIELQRLIREINDRLVELRGRATAPSMAEYDFLDTFKDPSSLLRAAGDKDALAKIRKLIQGGRTDQEIAGDLTALFGTISQSTEQVSSGVLSELQAELVKPYDDMISNLPQFGAEGDEFGKPLIESGRFNSMSNNTLIGSYTDEKGETQSGTVSTNQKNDLSVDTMGTGDFVSFGSVFMEMVAKPIRDSGQYDEVQVIFYPFNRLAGAVHDLPTSAFPIEKDRLRKAVKKMAESSPEISARQIIGMIHSRFTHFTPARAYLMAGFYDQEKATDGTTESIDPKKIYTLKLTGGGSKEVAANVQQTFESRLQGVGIPEAKFGLPNVEVAVEACPLLDLDGEPKTDDRKNPKTLIKIHVYDAAMDPHSTLTDIIKASKDNELGVITVPVATLNATARSSGTSNVSIQTLAAALKVITAGEKAGILQAVRMDTLAVENNPTLQDAINGLVYYRLKGGYDEIKKLVASGMPTITYGSSTSAMTNASLSSNTSAGLGNVQLLRAFTSPGEVAAENIDTGVPMAVVPATLSISTIGCPLFSPMQRFFVDFGTGTSIDNVYAVLSVDSTIGKDGFKTDVKLGFAEGFASYRSLNQNLAMLAANFRETTGVVAKELPADALKIGTGDIVREQTKLQDYVRGELTNALVPAAVLEAEVRAAIERKVEEAKQKVAAEIEEQKRNAQAKIEAIIPEKTKVQIAEAQRKVAEAKIEIDKTIDPIKKAALYAQKISEILSLANGLPPEVAVAIISGVQASLDEARAIAAANAKAAENATADT